MHILSANQFTRTWLDGFFNKVGKPKRLKLSDKILGSLFYEVSTRTRLSFESAMLRLGGKVLSETLVSSSLNKKESLADTVRVISEYCDVLVIRHPDIGSAELASRHSLVPVINAGDGSGEHPTQALLDAYTVRERYGRLSGLKIAFVGDLLYGRTVHSLIQLLLNYEDNTFFFVNKPNFSLPEPLHREVWQKGNIRQFHDLTDCLRCEVDVVYMTRAQEERGSMSHEFVFNHLDFLKQDSIVLHPLPRNQEIPTEVDSDPRMWYFRAVRNGLHVRQALLGELL